MAEVALTLGEKQRLFVSLVRDLIAYVYASGYELSFGEAYRTDEQAEINAMGPVLRGRLADLIAGIYPELAKRIRNNGRFSGSRESLHTVRLAIDLNLFRDGVYLTDTDSHAKFGAYWKALHPLCRWGGDFASPDGNHYSLEHEGRK